MFYRKTLEDNLIGVQSVEGLIDAFEQMCAERSGLFDDMLFFESGNFKYSGKEEYYLSLARQYKDSVFSEDFTVLRLDIIYPAQKISFKNRRLFKRRFTSDKCGGSYSRFFALLRESPLLAHIKESGMQYLRYEISEEEV